GGGDGAEPDAAGRRAHLLQDPPREPFVRAARDDDPHDLALGELADDLAVDPRDRREAARPVREAMGPGEPRGLVALPLRRHERSGGGAGGAAGAPPTRKARPGPGEAASARGG